MTNRVPKSAARNAGRPAAVTVPVVRTPAAAYDYFVDAAKRLAGDALVVCRIDPSLALHNVQIGVDSVRPHAARLSTELPALALDELWSLPDLAAGTIYAADRVGGPVGKIELATKLARLRQRREPMLTIAEGLALWGLLPEQRVAAIRAGTGPTDLARDGIALEALYREYAATLANKHPFSAADLQEVADLGNFIVRAVTPLGGRQRPEAPSEASVLRDRFYTLLLKRHGELRKAGYYLFGEDYDTLVPPLAGRVLGARKADAEPDADAGASPA